MNYKGTFSVTITPTKNNGDINVKSLQNYFKDMYSIYHTKRKNENEQHGT